MYMYYTSCIYKNTKTNLSFHEGSPILGHTVAPTLVSTTNPSPPGSAACSSGGCRPVFTRPVQTFKHMDTYGKVYNWEVGYNWHIIGIIIGLYGFIWSGLENITGIESVDVYGEMVFVGEWKKNAFTEMA